MSINLAKKNVYIEEIVVAHLRESGADYIERAFKEIDRQAADLGVDLTYKSDQADQSITNIVADAIFIEFGSSGVSYDLRLDDKTPILLIALDGFPILELREMILGA